MEHQLIKPTKKSKSLSEMMISPENAAPTAFILDYMGNCGLKLMHEYLDRVFDTDISPTLAASYLIDAFPTITPAITSISGGSSDSCVSFLASDILVTRYVLFKHPIVDKSICCEANKFSNTDGFDFTVETSDFELSIVSLRPCCYKSELHKFISSIDEDMGQDTHYVLESANLIANNDGVGANNLHFVALLDAYGQPLYEIPDNHQLTRVLHACQAIAANKIQKTTKRDEILDKMLRAKNKKPLIKKLLTTQDTYS